MRLNNLCQNPDIMIASGEAVECPRAVDKRIGRNANPTEHRQEQIQLKPLGAELPDAVLLQCPRVTPVKASG